MGGRPFKRVEQQEFLNELVKAGLVDSNRVVEGDDGGRKFASAFKQLGFVTDWERGKLWEITPVGTMLIEHPELEELIFLRQLMKYQIPSPLEKGKRVQSFHVRPYRLLLRFLKQAHEENLIGLTKFEIALYIIGVLDEDDDVTFTEAMLNIRKFRADYDSITGKVNKNRFINQQLEVVAAKVDLASGSLLDYADSNGRYALITGLLTTHGNKLTLSDARLSVVEAILSDGTSLISNLDYLDFFYNPNKPLLPTDDLLFLQGEIVNLEKQFVELATLVSESPTLPTQPTAVTISELQAYEIRLRDRLRDVREIQFYRNQCSAKSLDEIEDLLEDIHMGTKAFFGGLDYAPAILEWVIWRLFLAINEIIGPISKTRGFRIDEDINPIHHARGGAADLTFTYNDFKLVCEMTLMTGSRQFAAEGEPVTRHVFTEIESSGNTPVYGLFVTKKLDPNTADAFHHARYWRNRREYFSTPIVALEIEQIIALVKLMQLRPISPASIRELLDSVLQLQDRYSHGPGWYEAYSRLYVQWVNSNH